MITPSETSSGLHPEARTTIALRDVNFAYRRAPVVVGFKWEVPSHGISALLGLSGAGKSTLLALMAGALKPSSGSITLDGRDPASSQTRRLIGFMPQVGGLYDDLSVEENIAAFGAGVAASTQGIEQTIDFLYLKQRRREPVRELSAGHQQRVSLGIALVGGPSFILLDEPFAYADGEFARRLWSHLRELASKGRTIVIATSRPDVAAQADSVAVVRNGRLLSSHVTSAIAPGGRGNVVLHYREKSGARREVVPVTNYRKELAGLVTGSGTKPFEVEVQPQTLEEHLERLITEDPDLAAHRA